MKSLTEHNRETVAFYQAKKPFLHTNDIACPKCGSELAESEGHRVSNDFPASVQVICLACGFVGRRLL